MQWMPDSALGVYVSIPFCRSKCTYCNFASGVYPASEHARYVDRLVDSLAGAGDWAAGIGAHLPRMVDTIFLGGGTPSLLEPELIQKLFAAIRAHFRVAPNAEITAECAPGQLPQPTLEALAEAGVNRVSLGVQSFIDAEAHASGRLHSRAMVLDDVRRLRAAGIANLNLDLIAGLAGQTFASWNESLAVLLETGVPHASIYMLEVDEDSRLGRELLSGGVRYRAGLVPNDDTVACMYETAIDRLTAAGLAQYEISNFARPGHESRHNLRYWQRRPYLGLGLDASSALYAASGSEERADLLRSTTTDDLQAYLNGLLSPETERLDRARRHEEAWFLGLRLNAGVDPADLAAEFGPELLAPALKAAARLAADGLLEANGARIRLTARGRLLSNEVFQSFLDLHALLAPA
ncbi:MAG TPA: radical SAM family heme chaperone HemW [Terracidiphilus sp.]|jgi:oxygen-independent coproporphyrinogen-3 oxidase|nr:radical SAM family heme chaperone HemW [Terracidiphilus sp.]